ncbi:hypothetical protein Tco_0547473 [Tanacetum coccineum]
MDFYLINLFIAYLEKTEGNVEFHEVIDFLWRSYIYHALTVSPVVSTTFVEQFWTSAKSKTINNVRHITAKVAGKFVSISEASIRTDLIFDDADGIDSLPNQAIFDAIRVMGYEGDLTMLTFNKALFSPQWRPSPKPSPTPIVPDSIPEPTGENLGDHSSNDTSLSGNEDDMTLQNVYDLWRKIAKGESSVQRDPLFDVMPEDKIDHMETENAQSEGRTREMVDEDKEFDEVRLSTEDIVSTDQGWSRSTDEQLEGTEEEREGTEEKVESTDEQIKGSEDQTKEEIATQASQTSTQTPTSMIFGDDETIATPLLNRERARIFEADRFLLRSFQEQKEEQFTIEERAKFFMIQLPAQRKFLARQNEQDEFWSSQHEWKVVSWKLHSSSGVHTLMTDEGLVVHMLIEKKYPLKKEILMQMLKLKLESEEDSTMALELI